MRSLTTVALLLASAGMIQAQAHSLGLPDFGNLTSSAILGWYAWHTASRTIPGLVRHFREELAACRAYQRAEQETFREELAAERAQRSADQAEVVEVLGQIRDQLKTMNHAPRPDTGTTAECRLRSAEL
jgi:hypothetical protein